MSRLCMVLLLGGGCPGCALAAVRLRLWWVSQLCQWWVSQLCQLGCAGCGGCPSCERTAVRLRLWWVSQLCQWWCSGCALPAVRSRLRLP